MPVAASVSPLVHLSTDYVFDGKASRPYREDDPTNPLGVYGQSKLEGEEAIRTRLPKHLIVRTSWLYGVHGQNFVKTILRLAKERKKLRVVSDQYGCRTWTGDLGEALIAMVGQIHENRSSGALIIFAVPVHPRGMNFPRSL